MIHFRIAQTTTYADQVLQSFEARARRAFMTIGAGIRREAIRSIQRAATASTPGEPPHTPTGILKRSIFFEYQPARKGVIVGPVALAAKGRALSSAGRLGRPTIASVLEFGGRVLLQGRVVTVAARPFMRPALARAAKLDRVRAAWESVL